MPTSRQRRPVLFRGGTVLTMDDAHTVLTDADVLVVDDRIAEVGTGLTAPDGAVEIDATGGIVMPGMIDTHRHMWQTAMRAYGADWTLTQYFVWYYLEHGKHFRPEDIYAGNLLVGLGRARGRRHHHRRLVARPADRRPRRGRGRRAARRCRAGSSWPTATSRPAPWEWTADPAVQAFLERSRIAATTCSASSSRSTSPATRRSPSGRPSRWPASSGSRSPPTPASGARPTTTASG